MAQITVSAERAIAAPADAVYGYVADHEHHARFLPPAFQDFRVEAGGVGAGTITRFTLNAGGRTREYRMEVAEPEPGRVLTESDTESSLVTTWTIEPEGTTPGSASPRRGRGPAASEGSSSAFSAPRVMRGLYADQLERLDAYAREQQAAGSGGGAGGDAPGGGG